MPRDTTTTSTARGRDPAVPACETCRLRKVRCQRPEVFEYDPGMSCQACTRKGIQCIYVDRPKTRNRSGKVLETARARYGAVTPSTANKATPQALLPAQESLAAQELACSVGSRLFESWLDQAQARTGVPNMDASVLDFSSLLQRYRAVNRRLERLTPVDQLFCRAIYAAAAPVHLPAKVSGGSRRSAALQLREEAENFADSLAVWRKPDPAHVTPLLLLYKTHNIEDAKSESALPYLSAAITQTRQLAQRAESAALAAGKGSDTTISWTVVIMDVLGAVERGQRPHLSREEITGFLGKGSASLPILEDLRSSIGGAAEASQELVMRGPSTLVLVAYDTAATAASWDRTRSSLDALWLRLDDVYRWCRDTATFAGVHEEHAGRVYWRYGTLMWATAIAIELSLVSLVGSTLARCTLGSTEAEWSAVGGTAELENLSTVAQRRVETQLCAYLPLTCDDNGVDSLDIFAFLPGVTCSVSRVLDMAQVLARTPVSDPVLFPLGAADRLRMVDCVLPQIRHLQQGYPSVKLDQTLNLLETEQRRMLELLGAHVELWHTVAGAAYAPPAFLDPCTAPDNTAHDLVVADVAGAPIYDYLINAFSESAVPFPQSFCTSLDATDLAYLSHVPVDTSGSDWSML